jgi:hypothetical protein
MCLMIRGGRRWMTWLHNNGGTKVHGERESRRMFGSFRQLSSWASLPAT